MRAIMAKKNDKTSERTPDEGPEEMVTRSIRLPKDLMEWLDREAKKRRRTTNNYLEVLLAEIKEEEDQGRAG